MVLLSVVHIGTLGPNFLVFLPFFGLDGTKHFFFLWHSFFPGGLSKSVQIKQQDEEKTS